MILTIVRRFKVKGALLELRKPMEAPGVPTSGMLLDLGNGPPVSVSHVVMHLRPAEWTPGFYPCSATVFTMPEAEARMLEAEKVGWRATEP